MASSQEKYKIERYVIIPPDDDPDYCYSPEDFEIAHYESESLQYPECEISFYRSADDDVLIHINPSPCNVGPSFFDTIQTHEIGLTFDQGFILNLSSIFSDLSNISFHILVPGHVDYFIYRSPESLGLSICFYYSEGGDQDE